MVLIPASARARARRRRARARRRASPRADRSGRRVRGGHADVGAPAGIVVEAEEARADHGAGSVLVPSEAGDRAIGGARVRDLEHRALARPVRLVEALGYHAVEARGLEAADPV